MFLFLVWFLWLGLPVLCWIGVVREGILVLFLILVGKLLVFPNEYDVGCRSVIYGLYYVEKCPLYSHFAECFYHKWVLYLIKCFFHIYWYDQMIFVFPFMWCITFIDLWILYHPHIPGMNPTWSWYMIFLMYYWMGFANILLRVLASWTTIKFKIERKK